LAAKPSPELAIPATLHASLTARLDRLGPLAKEVAQIGAVLGREFSYDLIEQVAGRPAAELRLGLDQLAEAGLLFCRGVAPRASYLFKHALVQDAARAAAAIAASPASRNSVQAACQIVSASTRRRSSHSRQLTPCSRVVPSLAYTAGVGG